ncbi:hypothetical protein [Bacillus massiliigorillae]|nr:hypothetical protein [Bacillus massiliigorillae]
MKKNKKNVFIYDEKGIEDTTKQIMDSYCSGGSCDEKKKNVKKER